MSRSEIKIWLSSSTFNWSPNNSDIHKKPFRSNERSATVAHGRGNFIKYVLRIMSIVLLLCLIPALCVKPAFAVSKRLVFATIACHWLPATSTEACAANPNIDGLGLEVEWRKLEPQPGKYDWSTVDNAIRIAAKHGKHVVIYFIASPVSPDWLTEGGKAQTFFSGTISRGIMVDVLPWDKVYIARYSQFIQAAAQHFKSLNMTPYIFAVGVVAPQRDCTVEGSRLGRLGKTNYDREKHLLACEQMLDVYAKAFPTARLLIPAPHDQMVCLPQKDPAFFQSLMTYGLTKHGQGCWLFARDLCSSGSSDATSYLGLARRTGLAYQIAAKNSSNIVPENFKQAVDAGVQNGAIYFEILPELVTSQNTVIQNTISQLHH